jgi:antitoxin component HigA of HigAB toxin-antitoxin module
MTVMTVEKDTFLPTIATAYAAVDEYLERLAQPGEGLTSPPPVTVQPIDALLISLLAAYQPGRPHVIDLASEVSCGASTVLCRTIPAVRSVGVPRSFSGGWRSVMLHYLRDLEQPLAEVYDFENEEAVLLPANAPGPLLVLTAPRTDAATAFAAKVARWLASRPQALVLVLDVGETGVCPILAALTGLCLGAPRRLALLRERAPALAGSRLAIVGHRSNDALEEALARVGHLFNDHFQYLEMVKRACLSAMDRAPEEDTSLRPGEIGQHTEHSEPDSMRVLRRMLEERTRELQDLRSSMTVRLVTRMHRLVRWLAPPGSPQRWVALKARAGARRMLRGRPVSSHSGF